MRYFDCDVAYGRGSVALPREIETAEELLAELDHCGIQEALVWHRDSLERDFDAGNRRLVELNTQPRLHRTLTFVPTCCPEMLNPEVFIRRMRGEGVRAVRAFPTMHCFLLEPLSCGPLLDLFVACCVPLFVPLNQFRGEWQGVYELMRQFPRLTLIVTETGCWGQDRYFRPLMKHYERFFMTTSRLETAGQLKGIVDSYGTDHLLFGSALPFNNPGGYIMMLERAAIKPEAKEAIAYRNIERILEKVVW